MWNRLQSLSPLQAISRSGRFSRHALAPLGRERRSTLCTKGRAPGHFLDLAWPSLRGILARVKGWLVGTVGVFQNAVHYPQPLNPVKALPHQTHMSSEDHWSSRCGATNTQKLYLGQFVSICLQIISFYIVLLCFKCAFYQTWSSWPGEGARVMAESCHFGALGMWRII